MRLISEIFYLDYILVSSVSLLINPCTLLLKLELWYWFYILLLLQVIEDLLCDCVNIFSNVLDGNNLNGWLELQEVSD